MHPECTKVEGSLGLTHTSNTSNTPAMERLETASLRLLLRRMSRRPSQHTPTLTSSLSTLNVPRTASESDPHKRKR